MNTIKTSEEFGRRDFLRGGAMTLAAVPSTNANKSRMPLADEGSMPDLGGAIGWLNSAPLNPKSLRGKVVLVDFWTYTCINSLRPLPYVKSWAAKHSNVGLVIIGAHTPEFSFEKETANVENSVRDLKVDYLVAIDSNYRVWQAFNNEYWPAVYIIDGRGRIRYHRFGEGEYDKSERVIQQLLKENGDTGLDGSTVAVTGHGVEAAPSADVRSPETYLGYRRTERFASPERLAHKSLTTYSPPAKPSLNDWGLSGEWNVGDESAVLQGSPAKIWFRFHSRDLHMVLSPANNSEPIRFKVKLDGAEPRNDSGADSAADGTGAVREPRLYQLIRQKDEIVDRTFEIEFLDAGLKAFVFTFG